MRERAAEFGHAFAAIKDIHAHVDAWGAGQFLIVAADGKTYRFEDSDRFGPALVKRNGDLLTNAWPAERSAFWRAHLLWRRQGRQISDDGKCVWREPTPTTYYVKRRGRHRWIVDIEEGEPDGKEIYIDTATGAGDEGGRWLK